MSDQPATTTAARDLRQPGPRAPRSARSPEAQRVVEARWAFVEVVCRATGIDTVVRGEQFSHFVEVSGLSSGTTRVLLYPTEAKGLTADQVDAMKAKFAAYESAAIEQLSWDPWMKSAFPEGSFPVKQKKEKAPAPKEPKTPKQAKAPTGSTPASSARGKRGRGDDADERSVTERYAVSRERSFLVSETSRETVMEVGPVIAANREFVVVLPAGVTYELLEAKDGRTFIVIKSEDE